MNELAEETRATLPIPQMLSGHLEGRLLEMLVYATRARRVLELGTYSGYSALAMASAMGPDGRVITCEFEDLHADFAQRHIDASPYSAASRSAAARRSTRWRRSTARSS